MSGENASLSKEKNAVSPRRIGLYFILLAFFGPAFALIYLLPSFYPPFQIWGMLWSFYYSIDYGGWHLDFSALFYLAQSIKYTLFRPVFAYQMFRFYSGESNKKQTLLVGLFIELQGLIVTIPESLIFYSPFYYSFLLPVPLSLLAAVFVIRNSPRQLIEVSWVEKGREQSRWWNPETEKGLKIRWSRAKDRFLTVANFNKVLGLALIAEIVLLIVGGAYATTLDSFPLRAYYGQSVPWFVLITGLLFLMTRPVKTE